MIVYEPLIPIILSNTNTTIGKSINSPFNKLKAWNLNKIDIYIYIAKGKTKGIVTVDEIGHLLKRKDKKNINAFWKINLKNY